VQLRGPRFAASQLISRLFPLLPLGYVLVIAGIGDLRIEHVCWCWSCSPVCVRPAGARAFLSDITPYVLVLLGYDTVRYARRVFVSVRARARAAGCAISSFRRSRWRRA